MEVWTGAQVVLQLVARAEAEAMEECSLLACSLWLAQTFLMNPEPPVQ